MSLQSCADRRGARTVLGTADQGGAAAPPDVNVAEMVVVPVRQG
ncbi:hypothetical protein OHT68_43390 [Streptomyces canus]|nr:hypothetical protein [Streptomyces canus]